MDKEEISSFMEGDTASYSDCTLYLFKYGTSVQKYVIPEWEKAFMD